jgi:signal transduction histidine kinase
MSHELRTPLNAILGFGQVLEMDNLTGEQGNCVGQIMRAGQHLLGLVDEVLDLSQLGMSGVKLSVESVQLERVVSDAVDRYRADAQQRNIELFVEPTAHELAVLADRQRLTQVLEIVISNAVKFNVPNGRITIWAEAAPDGRQALSVRDTGIGIDRDQFDRLFNAFDRIEEVAVQGTGLGLALAKQLVEAMSGTISVQSQKGAGCTVTVTLPLALAAPLPAIELEDEFPTLAAVGL